MDINNIINNFSRTFVNSLSASYFSGDSKSNIKINVTSTPAGFTGESHRSKFVPHLIFFQNLITSFQNLLTIPNKSKVKDKKLNHIIILISFVLSISTHILERSLIIN